MTGRGRKLCLAMRKTVRPSHPGVTGPRALSLVVEESGIERGNARWMENQSVLVNALGQYKSLSLVAKTSVQNGETGADGAVALLAVGRVRKQGTDSALG